MEGMDWREMGGDWKNKRKGRDDQEESKRQKRGPERKRISQKHSFAGWCPRKQVSDLQTRIDPLKSDLTFFFLGADYEYDHERRCTVIQMYGRMEETMASVQVRLSGFYPHFYIRRPQGWDEERIDDLIRVLDLHLRNYIAEHQSKNFEFAQVLKDHRSLIHEWKIVTGEELVGWWGPEPVEFIDIYMHHPKMVKHIKEMIFNPNGQTKTVERDRKKVLEEVIPAWCPPNLVKTIESLQVYEADVDFIVRFIVDKKFRPSSYYTLRAGAYTVALQDRNSRCELEINAPLHALSPASDDRARPAPDLIEIDKDIEVGTTGPFPDPKKALFPITKVSFVVSTYLDSCCKPGPGHECPADGSCRSLNYVFSLKSCKVPPNADHVFCYETERELMEAMLDFLFELDPDIVAHHNGNGFDIPYLIKRAEVLGVDRRWDTFGRSLKKKVYCKSHSSKGFKKWNACIPGVFNLDILRVAQDDTRLESHSLQKLSETYLGESKEEIHHTLMSKYQETPEGREKLAKYNMKDSILTRKIRKKKKYAQNSIGMGDSYVLAQVNVDRAQGAKIEPQLRIECNKEAFDSQGKQTKYRKFKISKRKDEKRKEISYDRHEGLDVKKGRRAKGLGKRVRTERADEHEEYDEDDNNRREDLAQAERALAEAAAIDEQEGEDEDECDDEEDLSRLFESQKNLRAEGLIDAEDDDDSYAGATVLKPMCGYYPDEIVITLDFEGMYPSIIRRHNLCYSTLVTREIIDRYGLRASYYDEKNRFVEEDYWEVTDFKIVEIRDEGGNLIDRKIEDVPLAKPIYFLTSKFKRGVLPAIEDDLAITRSRIKKDMAVIEREIERVNIQTGISELNKKIEDLNRTIAEAKKAGKSFADVEKECKACSSRISEIKKSPLGDKCADESFSYPNPYKDRPDYPSTLIRPLWLRLRLKEGKTQHQREYDLFKEKTVSQYLKELEQDYSNKDIAQNSKKLSQNSVYGLTGDQTSAYYQREIAETVTRMGRRMIATTKLEVERAYCRRTGWWFDSEVIYGDTDSVFVRLIGFCQDPKDPQSRGLAAFVGTMMASEITKKCFLDPIKLAYEKCWTNLNMIGPKNYYGLKWFINLLKPKLDVKGLQMIKRGPPNFIKETCKKVVEMLAELDDYDKAIQYAASRWDMLLDREVSVCDLIQRQKISKPLDEYGKIIEVKNKKTGKVHNRAQAVSAFVNLAKRIRERHPDREINEGDIISLVHVDDDPEYGKAKSKKTGDRTEEPLTVLMNGIPIDTEYYLGSLRSNLVKILANPVVQRNPIRMVDSELTSEGIRKARDVREEDLHQEKMRIDKRLAPLRRRIRRIQAEPEKYADDEVKKIEERMRDDRARLKLVNRRLRELMDEKELRVMREIESRCKKAKRLTPMQKKSGLFGYFKHEATCAGCESVIRDPNELPTYWCGICDLQMSSCECVQNMTAVPTYEAIPCGVCHGPLGMCSHRKSGNCEEICQHCALIIDSITDDSALQFSRLESEEKDIWDNCARCMSTCVREDLESCIAVECKHLGRRTRIRAEIERQRKRSLHLHRLTEWHFTECPPFTSILQ